MNGTPENKNTDKTSDTPFTLLPLALNIGFSIAVPIVLLTLLGRFADRNFETSPLFLIIGAVGAAVGASIIVWNKVKNLLN